MGAIRCITLNLIDNDDKEKEKQVYDCIGYNHKALERHCRLSIGDTYGISSYL